MNNMYRNMPYQTPDRSPMEQMPSRDMRMPMEQMPSRDMKMPMGHYMNKNLVMIIQDCESNCEHMVHHIDTLPDCNMRSRQSDLLNDCADICDLTAKYAARNTNFAKQATSFCAHICEVCGTECLRFTDEMSQHCAKVCFECARQCSAFSQFPM